MAARFSDRRTAASAREQLHLRLGVDPKHVEIAPLGDSELPEDPAATLLAGRFGDDEADGAAALLRGEGGEVVANVDESLTRPRMSAPRPGWSPIFKYRIHA